MNLNIGLLIFCTFFGINCAENCSKEEHQKCISLADPLLKDPQLIFPDNMKDIDNVCRTWSGFVDCIRRYIDKCFSKQRREQFNSAVEMPIASVHQMCSVSTYQAEYLKYASCIKATVIELEHCGNQYAALVNEVSRNDVTKANLCCAHHQFRTCVIVETKKRCDGNQVEGTAAKFARQNLDKALSFLQDQCQNYIPNSGNCITSSKDNSDPALVNSNRDSTNINIGIQSRPNHRSSSSDLFPGKASDFHGTFSNTAYTTTFKGTGRALVQPSSSEPQTSISDSQSSSARVLMNSPFHTTETSNVNEDNVSPSQSSPSNEVKNDEQLAVVMTQRSPTYGRGMSWTSSTPESFSEIPSWATSTWLDSHQDTVTDDSWNSATDTFGGNSIDEPNQQGLSNNSQISIRISYVCYALIFVLLCI